MQGALLQRSLSQLLGPRLAPMAAVHTDACKASKKELRKELRAALKRLSEDDKVQQSEWQLCMQHTACSCASIDSHAVHMSCSQAVHAH